MKTLYKILNNKFFIGVVFLLLGIGAGYLITRNFLPPYPTIKRITINNPNYKFIDPLLAYDVTQQTQLPQYKLLNNKLQSLITQLAADDPSEKIGVYFKDLRGNFSVGINADEKFHPASLLKVPLMIAYFKATEANPNLLNEKIFYGGGYDANQLEYIKPQDYIRPGNIYTINDLIRYMIVYSDNNAANLLLKNIDYQSFNKIFGDLGIQLPNSIQDSIGNFITPTQFALFFRILRNSTYLTTDASEQALNLLSQTTFNDGLIAGLPSGITVSHKFGEYTSTSTDGDVKYQLHDCGLIYAQHTYVLCVMTMSNDYNDLKKDIASVSKLIYQEIGNNYQ